MPMVPPKQTGGAPMQVKDRIVVVTGAASGIGKEIARTYLREGAKVAIADLNIDAANAAAKELDNTSRQCIGVSFTFDHRVLDGEGAGRFMAALKRFVEHPLEFLLHLR